MVITCCPVYFTKTTTVVHKPLSQSMIYTTKSCDALPVRRHSFVESPPFHVLIRRYAAWWQRKRTHLWAPCVRQNSTSIAVGENQHSDWDCSVGALYLSWIHPYDTHCLLMSDCANLSTFKHHLKTSCLYTWRSGVAQWLGRPSVAGGLSLIYAWSIIDMWPLRR